MSTNLLRSNANRVSSGDRVIVRAGGKEWVIVHPPKRIDAEHITHETTIPTNPNANHVSIRGRIYSLKDFVLWGSVLGVLLACLSIMGLRTAPNHKTVAMRTRASVSTKPHRERVHSVAKSSSPGVPITVPAVRLYGLYVAPASSPGSPHLFRVAAYSADLLQYKAEWSGKNPVWSIHRLAWNVRQVQTASDSSNNVSGRVSTWLSSEVSAISALAAAIADGAPAKDAWTAYQTAKTILPQQKYIQATGHDIALNRIAQDVQKAFVAAGHGEDSSTETAITNVYVDLGTFHN